MPKRLTPEDVSSSSSPKRQKYNSDVDLASETNSVGTSGVHTPANDGDSDSELRDFADGELRKIRQEDSYQLRNAPFHNSLLDTIVKKASGNFVLAKLILESMRSESLRGGLAYKKRLNELPSTISEIYRNMIIRGDREGMERQRLCIMWMLFARRPLSPAELCLALWTSLARQGLADADMPDTASATMCERLVSNSSNGFAVVSKPRFANEKTVVRFAHDSVYDFFVRDGGLHELWPSLGTNLEPSCHEQMMSCCLRYLLLPEVQKKAAAAKYGCDVSRVFHFYEYAAMNVLYHAEKAGLKGNSSPSLKKLLGTVLAEAVAKTEEKSFGGSKIHYDAVFYDRRPGWTSNMYVLADYGCANLIRAAIESPDLMPSLPEVGGTSRNHPLFAAIEKHHADAVLALLGLGPGDEKGLSIIAALPQLKARLDQTCSPLSWAAKENITWLAEHLVHHGANVNEQDNTYHTPLMRAAAHGHADMVRFLLDAGANINLAHVPTGRTSLLDSLDNGWEATARLLIDAGADVAVSDETGETSLMIVAKHSLDALDLEAVTRTLIDKGADVNARDEDERTALTLLNASARGYMNTLRFLVEKGADVNATSMDGTTARANALWAGNNEAVKFLEMNGATA